MNTPVNRSVEAFDQSMGADLPGGQRFIWHSPDEAGFQICGFAWYQQERKYRRMPTALPDELIPSVDYLANHTAGGQIRFRTNSSALAIHVKLAAAASMPHMPSTGQCGFDCYVEHQGEMVFINSCKYPVGASEYTCLLFDFSPVEMDMNNIVLHFPLYQGVREVWIGFMEQAEWSAPSPYLTEEKVIVYGTSITQGGCASRPGMSYTNILSRRFPLEFINLGFSGSGRGEPAAAQIIAEIASPACLILDYEANCKGTEKYKQTLPEFIRIYRNVRKNTPILLVSQNRLPKELFRSRGDSERLERLSFQSELVRTLRDSGDPFIFFADGSSFLGESDFYECTVDGGHPTDLGFFRIANALTPVLKSILSL